MNGKSLLLARRVLRPLSRAEEAWGNRSVDVLVVPPGYTPDDYCSALRLLVPYSYPSFSVRIIDGVRCVVEENYYSIGD